MSDACLVVTTMVNNVLKIGDWIKSIIKRIKGFHKDLEPLSIEDWQIVPHIYTQVVKLSRLLVHKTPRSYVFSAAHATSSFLISGMAEGLLDFFFILLNFVFLKY